MLNALQDVARRHGPYHDAPRSICALLSPYQRRPVRQRAARLDISPRAIAIKTAHRHITFAFKAAADYILAAIVVF